MNVMLDVFALQSCSSNAVDIPVLLFKPLPCTEDLMLSDIHSAVLFAGMKNKIDGMAVSCFSKASMAILAQMKGAVCDINCSFVTDGHLNALAKGDLGEPVVHEPQISKDSRSSRRFCVCLWKAQESTLWCPQVMSPVLRLTPS